MRKSRQEAAETRERIVKVAAREFNESGIQSTGLSEFLASDDSSFITGIELFVDGGFAQI